MTLTTVQAIALSTDMHSGALSLPVPGMHVVLVTVCLLEAQISPVCLCVNL